MSTSKLPNLAALFLVILGLLIGLLGGFGSGSIFGGVVAALAIIPACWGMWAGVQNRESQVGLLGGILLALAALTVGGLLIVLRVVDWVR